VDGRHTTCAVISDTHGHRIGAGTRVIMRAGHQEQRAVGARSGDNADGRATISPVDFSGKVGRGSVSARAGELSQNVRELAARRQPRTARLERAALSDLQQHRVRGQIRTGIDEFKQIAAGIVWLDRILDRKVRRRHVRVAARHALRGRAGARAVGFAG